MPNAILQSAAEGADASAMNAPRPRVAVALFLFFFGLYGLTSSGNAFRVPDEFEVYFQAEHLVDAGDISVPQTLAIGQNGQSIFFGRFGRDGRAYAPYGPGVAYAVAPFHLLGRAVAWAAGVPRRKLPNGIAWEFLVGGITTLAMAFAAALAVAGAFRAFRAAGASEHRSLRLALLLGGATILWPYAGTLYSEAWLAAACIWPAALLLEARAGGATARPRVIAAAAFLVAAILLKPTAVVIAPGFVIAAVFDRTTAWPVRSRVALTLTAAILLGGAAQAAWNIERFGSPLEFGYNLAGMVPHLPARAFSIADLPRGVVVQLLSPGKALLVWAPPLLLSLVAVRDAARREPAIVGGIACSFAAAVCFYAAFLYPEGGYAHGPRHLVPLVPILLLPAAMSRTRFPRALVIGCAAIGIVVAGLAVAVSFFEDQSPPPGLAAASPYYDRIDPPPGRPFNQYRLDYVPFVTALSSGQWLAPNRPPGNGPDFFVAHLARARRLLPGGSTIPPWLPWAVGTPFGALLLVTGYWLKREWKSTMNRSKA